VIGKIAGKNDIGLLGLCQQVRAEALPWVFRGKCIRLTRTVEALRRFLPTIGEIGRSNIEELRIKTPTGRYPLTTRILLPQCTSLKLIKFATCQYWAHGLTTGEIFFKNKMIVGLKELQGPWSWEPIDYKGNAVILDAQQTGWLSEI